MSSDSLYVGVDLSKRSHVAALLSTSLLTRHGCFEDCPTLSFAQSRVGFEHLYATLTRHATASQICVLVERTGHYGAPLEQYLHEQGIAVYRVHVREHVSKRKTDKRDAQALAVLLYNQIELCIPVLDKTQRARLLVAPTPTATLLRGLVQHRQELVRESTQRKNQLTSIVDELFPEMEQVFRDVNSASALALRKAFPTPQAVASADVQALCATRPYSRPSSRALATLQELARRTIGTKNEWRMRSLVTEQGQLMTELALLESHAQALTAEIEQLVRADRAGRILLSFPSVGVNHASVILAYTGNVANFQTQAQFRSFCGWAPTEFQTGVSFDYSVLKKSGHSMLKQTLYLITMAAIQRDTRWAELYQRMLPVKARYNARKGKWEGTMSIIGRICGQMAGVMYTLLRRDAEVLAALKEGEDMPEPELYDPQKHFIGKCAPSAHVKPPVLRLVEQTDGE